MPDTTDNKPAKPPRLVYVNFATAVTDKSAQVLTGVLADQLAKGVREAYVLYSAVGGTTTAAYHLYQLLRALPLQLTMHAMGEVAGLGLVPLLAADTRLAVPEASFMLTAQSLYNRAEPAVTASGKGSKAKAARQRPQLRQPELVDSTYHAIIDAQTKVGAAELEELGATQYWQDANWARRRGLVQRIAAPKLPANATIIQPSYL